MIEHFYWPMVFSNYYFLQSMSDLLPQQIGLDDDDVTRAAKMKEPTTFGENACVMSAARVP